MDLNEKQIAILEVAEMLISEKGFEAASVREISKRANINLAMVNYYFGSKEKLLEALFTYRTHEAKIQIENLFQEQNMSAIEKILVIGNIYTDKVFRNSGFHKIMLKETSHIESPTLFEYIKRIKLGTREVVNRFLQEGKDKGEINQQVNIDHIISLIIGTSAHIILNEKFYAQIWDLDPNIPFDEQAKPRIKEQISYSIKAILTYNETK